VEDIGSLVLHLDDDFKFHLNNVLYIPSLRKNLILV
jgi:hypothetical protein